MILPNYIILFQENCNPRIDRRMVRLFSKKSIDSFVNKLESVNWNPVLHESNVSSAFDKLSTKVCNSYNSCFPKVKLSRKRMCDKKMD